MSTRRTTKVDALDGPHPPTAPNPRPAPPPRRRPNHRDRLHHSTRPHHEGIDALDGHQAFVPVAAVGVACLGLAVGGGPAGNDGHVAGCSPMAGCAHAQPTNRPPPRPTHPPTHPPNVPAPSSAVSCTSSPGITSILVLLHSNGGEGASSLVTNSLGWGALHCKRIANSLPEHTVPHSVPAPPPPPPRHPSPTPALPPPAPLPPHVRSDSFGGGDGAAGGA